MTKAIAASTTRTTRALRSVCPSFPVPAPSDIGPPRTLADLDGLPAEYTMRVLGACMEPTIPDRAEAVFSKTAAWKVGDIVTVWMRPELVGPGEVQVGVKVLTMAPPFYVKAFPFKDHPQSNVAAVFFLESFNPRQRLMVRCADVLAIHKFIGFADGAGEIVSGVSANPDALTRRAARRRQMIRSSRSSQSTSRPSRPSSESQTYPVVCLQARNSRLPMQ